MNARIAFASQAPTAVEDQGQYKRHAVLGVANDLRGEWVPPRAPANDGLPGASRRHGRAADRRSRSALVRVLDALRKVPRELFLPERMREFAYDDSPLPIDAEQTISQPYIVALMTEALELAGGEKVLEIGSGSGYAAAVLSEIAGEVYTVERIGKLAEGAARCLADLHRENVHVLHADGTLGWPEHAPYDAIIVAAGGPQIPETLKRQLKVGGRLVIPIGVDLRAQELVRVTRLSEHEFETQGIADVRFVPLLGQEGMAARRKCRNAVWLDETQAVTPIRTRDLAGLPDTRPFGP